MSYTKLFSGIVHSTVWREPNHVRLVWVTMLALADRDGVVEASIPGLADAARVTIPECEQALERLKQPDPYSRSKAHDGRRIQDAEQGWVLLNHEKYRRMASKEEAKAKNAERQKRWRERNATSRNVTPEDESNAIAAPSPAPSPDPPNTPPAVSRESRKPRRKPKIPIPADWTPNAAHAEKAATLGLNLRDQAERFRNNAEGKDVRWVDWDKAFHNWLSQARDFGQSKAPGLTQHEATLAEEDQALLHRARQGEFGAKAKAKAKAGQLDIERLKIWLRERNQRAMDATDAQSH